MSYDQGKLFPQAEKLKLKNARVDRLTRSYWDRLWKKDYDPGYILKLEPDDIPSITRLTVVDPPASPALAAPQTPVPGSPNFAVRELVAVVLSKGLEDVRRRVVAADSGGWITGLYLSLLQRQVREGNEVTQGKCYAILTRLECDPDWQFRVDRWTQDLLLKRRF